MKPSTHSTLPSRTRDHSQRQRRRPRTVDFLRPLAFTLSPRPDRFVRPRPDPPDAGPRCAGPTSTVSPKSIGWSWYRCAMASASPPRSTGHGTHRVRCRRSSGERRTTSARCRSRTWNAPSALLKFALDAIERGYAFVVQNERGKFFSEGDWEILGRPRTDGYDALTWIADQPWSSGNVATLGCSSTAEWQMGLAAMRHPAHAAAVPMGQGAGIGRMGPFHEQGNFYRGGALQLPMGRVALRRAEHPAPDLPAGHQPRGTWSDSRPTSTWRRRCRPSTGNRRCGTPADPDLDRIRRRAEGNLRSVRRPHAGRRGLVRRRPLPRRRAVRRAGAVGQLLVRPVPFRRTWRSTATSARRPTRKSATTSTWSSRPASTATCTA